MADRSSLGMVGYIFGGVTLAVMLIAFLVVKGHLDGRYALGGAEQPIVAASVPSMIR